MERNAFTSALSLKVCSVAEAVVTAAVYGNWRSRSKTYVSVRARSRTARKSEAIK